MQRKTVPEIASSTVWGGVLLLVMLSLNAGCDIRDDKTGAVEEKHEPITFEAFVANVTALAESDGVSVVDNLSELAAVVWAQEGPALNWLQWGDEEYSAAQEWLDDGGQVSGPGPALMSFLTSIADLAPDLCYWDQPRCVPQDGSGTTPIGQCAFSTFTNPHIHYACGRWETRTIDTGGCFTRSPYNCVSTPAPLGKICY